MRVLTTWEGMPVPLPEGPERRVLAERILRKTESGPSPAFRWKRGRLYAGEMAGCIQIGDLRINVLPKTDDQDENNGGRFLLNLLRYAGYLKRTHIAGTADVETSMRDPLEAVISEVAAEMTQGLLGGIPKRYELRQEDSLSPKGRIDFNLLSRRLASRIDLPISHAPLSVDNILAQCIKALAIVLQRITRSERSRQAFAAVLMQLAGVRSIRPTLAMIDSISLSRYETHWTRSLAIARLVLAGQAPDPTHSGRSAAFSILFPLHHLFERSLRRLIAEAMQGSGIAVDHRSRPLHLYEDPATSQGILRLRPDYLFTRDGESTAIADAKWKRATEEGKVNGIEREDLYQIHAYLTRFNVKRAVVFLPIAPWMGAGWKRTINVMGGAQTVTLLGTDIAGLIDHNNATREPARAAFKKDLVELIQAP